MESGDSAFAGSISALYDRYLGPALFDPYAEDLVRRVADLAAGAVLETAAGTGRVTRVLARVLPVNVSITATDLNQAMLDFAAAQDGVERVAWQHADATALPFDDARFDAVVCQFGAMFFPDKVAAHREALRVLKPAGVFCSTSGTGSRPTNSRRSQRKRSPRSFPTIRRGFCRGRLMHITAPTSSATR
jgi:SAM-dependent methyltransferase